MQARMSPDASPVVVVPDASPLIHLAAAGHLTLLNALGRVVVMDVVGHEAASDRTRPWALDIAAWLDAGQAAGSIHPFEVAVREVGEAYRLARIADPRFRLRGAGERAIRDWLVDALPHLSGAALVIYEDEGVPKLIRRERFSQPVVMATTRAVLMFTEERGLIASAEESWNAILRNASGANLRASVLTLPLTRTP